MAAIVTSAIPSNPINERLVIFREPMPKCIC
jgi:hypothetical protein